MSGLVVGIVMVWGIVLGRRSMERAGLSPVLMYLVAASLVVLGVASG
jgi:hypothetical protein